MIPDDLDIVVALREWARVGEACPPETLERAASEIARLRSLAGAVTPGPSLADVRKDVSV